MVRRFRFVVQARMGSTRLPGKIAADVEGRPLLARVVERLGATRKYCEYALEVMVATSSSASDDCTARMCQEIGVACFRGDEADVLARYLEAVADLDDDDVVIRATADNPLYCPRRAAKIIGHHVARGMDYSCISDLSYVVPEVMRVGALRVMESRASTSYCREHVTPYFRQQPAEFRVHQFPPTWEGLRPEIRLTVDTSEELEKVRRIYSTFADRSELFSLEEVYALCNNH